jgi:hypothetical protein
MDMKAQTDRTQAETPIRDAAVVAWRKAQLIAAGCDLETSEQLARECGVDLHALIELLERGCPPGLAQRILAPLEGESRRC